MIGLEKGKVLLSEYDTNWPLEFENEKKSIQNTLTENEIRIEHVGSTSVENLCAKPIIDILIGINHFDEGYKFASLLQATGYAYKGENGIPGRHFFVKGDPRTHHLHMVEMNSVFFRDHLLFRDYLRENPEEKNQYAELKKSMAVKYVDDREKYTDSKAEFIQNILQKAKGKI
jgi:GrpB-like predicted nucleotidyltransferase (UPF0157 family)